jgi:hypothetical protein
MKGPIPLTPALLVATANAFVGLGEDRSGRAGSPQGELVECFLREVRGRIRGDGACGVDGPSELIPWDAAFVHHAGYWSHFDQDAGRSSWPLPATASVAELAQYAGISGALRAAPLFGDLFLLWSPAREAYVRTGIVVHVERFVRTGRDEKIFECITIEGNSDLANGRTGTLVLRHHRSFVPAMGDQFVRWTSLDGREERMDEIERALDEAAEATRAA